MDSLRQMRLVVQRAKVTSTRVPVPDLKQGNGAHRWYCIVVGVILSLSYVYLLRLLELVPSSCITGGIYVTMVSSIENVCGTH